MKIFTALLAASALAVAHAGSDTPARLLRAVADENAAGTRLSMWSGFSKALADMEAADQDQKDANAEAPVPAEMESQWGGKIKALADAEMESQWGGKIKALAGADAARENRNDANLRAPGRMEAAPY